MPIISINPTALGPLADASKPVLDNQRRPTVNLGGVADAAGALGRAGQMPMIDPSAFVGKDRAWAAIGDAVGKAGGILEAVAMKRAEAQNDVDIADADARLEQEQADFDGWKQAHPDPRDWQAEWSARSTKALGAVLGNTKLSADAKQKIELRGKSWASRSGIMIARDATKETFNRAKSATLAALARASFAGDEAAHETGLQVASQKGYFYDHEVEEERQRFRLDQERKQKQAVADAAQKQYDSAEIAVYSNPDVALRQLEPNEKGETAGWKVTPQQRLRLISLAKQRQSELDKEEFDSIADGIASDDPVTRIVSEEQMSAMRKRTSDADFARLKKMLANSQNTEFLQNQIKNAPENLHKLDAAIRAFDPTGDLQTDDAARAEFRQQIREQMPSKGGWRQDLVELLDRKFKPRDGSVPSGATELFDTHFQSFKDSGVLGDLNAPNQADKSKAATKAADMKFRLKGEFEQILKKDPHAFDAPGAMDQWMSGKINGDTNAAAVSSFGGSAPQSTTDVLKSRLSMIPVDGAKITSFGYPGDATPDSNSSKGIGAFTTEADAKAGADAPTRLKDGDIGVSPDMKTMFESSGIKPRSKVKVHLSDGTTVEGRWLDVTANDDQAKALGLAPLRGRIDLYNRTGKHAKNGVKVVGFEPIN